MNLPAKVRKYIEECGLLRRGDSVVVGASGGPDSLCLLDVLYRLSADAGWDFQLHVGHLDHGLRPEAAAEAAHVQHQAEARGLPFHAETADTLGFAQTRHMSIEEAARELRYDFLARIARALGASAIAVAHTADDQAETVLMHLLRGSGLAGLRGMRPLTEVRSRKLVRPLLTTTRAEVEAYCAERGLRPVRDASNLDVKYFRNRLRHHLLPELERYNPNIRAVLARTAEVLAGEYDLVRERVAERWAQMAQVEAGRVAFDRDGWLALSGPEQRALLREAVAVLRPGQRDIGFAPLESAVRFSRTAAPGRRCDLLGGLCVAILAGQVSVGAWDETGTWPEEIPLLTEAGQLAAGWRFCAERLEPGQWTPEQVAKDEPRLRAFVDAGRITAPLEIRARRPGDRFQPLGFGGHSVKLSDYLINSKIDAVLRDRWPLVVSGGEIVWVAGLRLDERFKVLAGTGEVMRMEFVRAAGGVARV